MGGIDQAAEERAAYKAFGRTRRPRTNIPSLRYKEKNSQQRQRDKKTAVSLIVNERRKPKGGGEGKNSRERHIMIPGREQLV